MDIAFEARAKQNPEEESLGMVWGGLRWTLGNTPTSGVRGERKRQGTCSEKVPVEVDAKGWSGTQRSFLETVFLEKVQG